MGHFPILLMFRVLVYVREMMEFFVNENFLDAAALQAAYFMD